MAVTDAVTRVTTFTQPPVTGLWCPHCALPSGVVVTAILETDGRPLGVTRARGCNDCGYPNVTETP